MGFSGWFFLRMIFRMHGRPSIIGLYNGMFLRIGKMIVKEILNFGGGFFFIRKMLLKI